MKRYIKSADLANRQTLVLNFRTKDIGTYLFEDADGNIYKYDRGLTFSITKFAQDMSDLLWNSRETYGNQKVSVTITTRLRPAPFDYGGHPFYYLISPKVVSWEHREN